MKKRKVQIKRERNEAKRERRDEREKLRAELGEDAPPKQEPKTLENTREEDETYVEPNDEEILLEDATDAMANYFAHDTKPKVLITTSPGAKVKTWKLCFELKKCVPNSEIFSRKNVALKKIVKQAIEKQFTDLVVIHEDYKKPNGLILSHLPDGPTAYFKINTLEYTKQIKGAGVSTSHLPEVILNNFKTRLGHTIGRMLACLFPHTPQYTGRRAVTFHNQRDYIFFRHHRYEFKENGERAALHELGPRFTLRLKWLQKGTYDTREGEYEWTLKTRNGNEPPPIFPLKPFNLWAYEFKENGERAALHELGPRFTLRLKWLQKGTYDTREGEYEWTLKRHEMETSRRRFFL